MERGPDSPAPKWMKWYFIIGGSIFCVAVVTMGILFSVLGRGNMYDYEDDYQEEDPYYRELNIVAELYSDDDTLVITNYGDNIYWSDYSVEIEGEELSHHDGVSYYYDSEIYHCDMDIIPGTYYRVTIYLKWSYYVVWSDQVYSSYGSGT